MQFPISPTGGGVVLNVKYQIYPSTLSSLFEHKYTDVSFIKTIQSVSKHVQVGKSQNPNIIASVVASSHANCLVYVGHQPLSPCSMPRAFFHKH